ncbi:MAG: putative metal-binding motif-containing protein, partial [Myxococcota bacterium]
MPGRWWLVVAGVMACTGDLEPPTPGEGPEPQSVDADGDGVPSSEDCDDADPDVFPGAAEVCDGIDNDCDFAVDDADDDVTDAPTWFLDADDDGFGADGESVASCEPPGGYVAEGGDCNDLERLVNPGATEICDTLDNDCDTRIDDDDDDVDLTTGRELFTDADGDGFGDSTLPVRACMQRDGLADNALDCDDTQDAVRPGAAEVCDGIDNDCNLLADDADPGLDPDSAPEHFADTDGDGFGDPATGVRQCTAPPDTVLNADDCDDRLDTISPNATEVCDRVDNDCDLAIDDDDPSVDLSQGSVTTYADSDLDGFGDLTTAEVSCAVPFGRTTNADDCDDTRSDVFPDAPEFCDGVRNDCRVGGGEEPGLATLTTPGGRVNIQGALQGTSSQDVAYGIDADGELALCEGTWFVSLVVQ